MAYETILYSVEEEVATLTLNRPEVQNGFNIQVCDEIMAAIEEAGEDASVKFLVINAKGKVFSVGGDLDQMKKAVAVDDVQSVSYTHLDVYKRQSRRWALYSKYGFRLRSISFLCKKRLVLLLVFFMTTLTTP